MLGNRIGCGLNHSIIIAPDKEVYVWGGSINDELGVAELKGFIQPIPYKFEIQSQGSKYTALEVACGESHTALLLKDDSLSKLKLIYHPEIDISSYFRNLISIFDSDPLKRLSYYHKEYMNNCKKLDNGKLQAFFDYYLPEESKEEAIRTIIALLLRPGKGKISYKEFRDQIYGTRLDDGRVLTWGNQENGRLGRDNSDEMFVVFKQEVSVTKIACGGSHCLAISLGRKLYAWGGNSYGQLGIGHRNHVERPELVPVEAEYLIDIAGGGSHSIALSKDGEMFTWGLGEGGRLGHGDTNLELYPRKVKFDSALRVESVAAGHSHSGCIIKGEIYTWGIGTYARLGHGNLSNYSEPKLVEFFKGRFMEKLCLSFFHSVVLSSNGEVWAWGNSKNGRLGIPTSFGENQLVPTRIGIGSLMGECKVVDIACGYKHGIALAKSGHVFAWGCALDGKLGIVTNVSEEPLPKEVKLPKTSRKDKKKKKENMPLRSTELLQVSCSSFNSYCLTNAGEILAWGSNSVGQCGVPSIEAQEPRKEMVELLKETPKIKEVKSIKDNFTAEPILIEALKGDKFKYIDSNGESFMGVTVDGKVIVWGSNDQGQLGTGFTPSSTYNNQPTLLVNFKRTEMKTVSCGSKHSAFLAENGEVYMCGSSENGRLGLGETVMNPTSPYQYIPRLILGLPNIKKISCGVSHTVAIDCSYHLWAWGNGWFGKLGTGNSEEYIQPVEIPLHSFYPNLEYGEAGDEERLKEVACGEFHTLLLTSKGNVYGAGFDKCVGIELIGSNEVFYFHKLNCIKDVKAIAAGIDHSLVVTSRGQLYGWGSNSYNKLGPLEKKADAKLKYLECHQIIITHNTPFEKVAAGSNHSAAISSDGVVFVWGAASSGRLGKSEEIVSESGVKPMQLEKISQWLASNYSGDLALKEVDEEEQYVLQSMLKNEPVEQHMETLLTEDQNIVYRLESLLMKYDSVREVQEERENLLSYIESLIVAKIEGIPSIPNPDFKLTLPPIVSKNFQLYEFFLACMQTHPCYMAKLVEHNPHLPTTEVSAIFKAIYGDMSNNPQKLRRLMLLYKLVLKISVANTDFQRSMKMKAGDISAYIYFYILQSQNCNRQFFAVLAAEIMGIVRRVSLGVGKADVISANLAENEEADRINHEANEEEKKNNESPEEIKKKEEARFKEMEKAKEGIHKIRDALNFKQLEDLGELPPELKQIYEERKKNYNKATNKVKKMIKNILTNHPKVRKRVSSDYKLSNEVKFMYKDLPSVFRERFKEQCNSQEGVNILDSKIVMLFFAPLVEMLREPIRLKRTSLSEFEKSMGGDETEGNLNERPNFDTLVSMYKTGFNLVADFIEDLGEWKKVTIEDSDKSASSKLLSKKHQKECKYRKKLVDELTKVPDLNLTDLSLADMLTTSLEADDYTLTITLEDLCNLHLLLLNNLKTLKKNFGKEDPVYIIIESLGNVRDLFRKILSGDTKSVKINLKLPMRWLLRERALQSCKECKTPLTYSLLKKPPPEEEADKALTVPTLWRCWNCGNTQNGWHMKCVECSAIRRDFPKEALFKNFQQAYINEELRMFTEILYEIPPIPPNISPFKFIQNLQEKNQNGTYLMQKLKAFVELLQEIGNNELLPDQRAEENILRLEHEAKFEFKLRESHKAYLDTMNNMLGDIEDKIKLICLQFNQNTLTTLRQASAAIAKGKNTIEAAATNKKSKRAQGRFTVDYLFKKNILASLDLPETIKKNTSFYFTEIESGAFEVRIVLREDRNYLCLPRDPIEVKIMGFSIGVDKLKAMRRTMNFRAQTSFEDGKVTFNVFEFVRMLGSLLGKCKQADF